MTFYIAYIDGETHVFWNAYDAIDAAGNIWAVRPFHLAG